MNVIALPAFQDNYLWLMHDERQALVVDPGDALPVRSWLAQTGLQLEAILVTHHHADHIGGVAELHAATGAQVWGPARERIPQPYTALAQDDVVHALGLRFSVLDVPGHTAGHIAYYCANASVSAAAHGGAHGGACASEHAGAQVDGKASAQTSAQSDDTPGDLPVLFCGDTLFSGGCGRLFEGTPAQMLASLDKLAALPGATRVFCTHEYTLSNLRFARAVEPDNTELASYQRHCETVRARGAPTLPTSLALEGRINPFLRTRQQQVAQAAHAFNGANTQDAIAVFAAIRQWKNEFK